MRSAFCRGVRERWGQESTSFPGFFPTSRENLGTKKSSNTLAVTVVSGLQNTRGSTLAGAWHWGGRGHITVRTKVSGVKISRIFQKIQEKRCLFQRFVTSIVVGTILSIVPTNCPWVSENVLIIMNLSQQQLWFVLTLLATRVTNINFLLTISIYF